MEASQITIEQVEQLAEKIAHQRSVISSVDATKKTMQEELDSMETEMLATLEILEKDSYDSSAGKFSVVHKQSIKTPKEIADKKALFAWLEEHGLFYELLSINSATLNKLYKEQRESLPVEEQLFFTLPGLEQPTEYKTLSFRKK